jgi:hypothetical protein
MSRFQGIAETARQFGVNPHLLSDFFFRGKLDSSVCEVIAGRKAIPIGYLPTIETVLRENGKLPQTIQPTNPSAPAVA